MKLVLAFALAILSCLVSACDLQPLSAESRVFLDLSLDFLGEYQLPKTQFQDTSVGGLSALAYDKKSDRLYALSDDRQQPRFYTLKLSLNRQPDQIHLKNVKVVGVTFLTDSQGQLPPPNRIDPEGMALTPQKTVLIASEGVFKNQIPPSICEFDLLTGRQKQCLPIPERYLPAIATQENPQPAPRGIQDNLGFESLTLNPAGLVPASGEPIRLFTATESALIQDLDNPNSNQGAKIRFLHYLLSDGAPLVIAEHAYILEPPPDKAIIHGLSELLAIDSGGHFLSLERSLSLLGFHAQIFQLAIGGATDTSLVASLKGEKTSFQPIAKKLILDFQELGITLDNLEGMTFGPRLPDGSQSLIVASDDNFEKEQVTQFLLFRIKSK